MTKNSKKKKAVEVDNDLLYHVNEGTKKVKKNVEVEIKLLTLDYKYITQYPLIIQNIAERSEYFIDVETIIKDLMPNEDRAKFIYNNSRGKNPICPVTVFDKADNSSGILIQVDTSDGDSTKPKNEFLCLNVPSKGIKIIKNGSKKGLNFIKMADWDRLKQLDKWKTNKDIQSKIAEFDFYIKQISSINSETSSPVQDKPSLENLVYSAKTRRAMEQGTFEFDDKETAQHPREFNANTQFDDRIKLWMKRIFNPFYLEVLNRVHRCQVSDQEIGQKTFASLMSIDLADACRNIFWPFIKKSIKESYKNFTSIAEVSGITGNKIPDYSVSLPHISRKEGNISFLLQEEKITTDKSNNASAQINGYAQKIFEIKEVSGQVEINYSFFTCVLISQETKEVRIVEFRNKKEQSLSGLKDYVIYSRPIPLLQRMEAIFDLEQLELAYEIQLKAICRQLQALKLLEEQQNPESFTTSIQILN